MKSDAAAVEVFLSLEGRDVRVGRLTREPRRGFEAIGFSYADTWLEHPDRYALQPGLVLAPGFYVPLAGRAVSASRRLRQMGCPASCTFAGCSTPATGR